MEQEKQNPKIVTTTYWPGTKRPKECHVFSPENLRRKEKIFKFSKNGSLIETWEGGHGGITKIKISPTTHKQIFEETWIGESQFLKISDENSGEIIDHLVHLDERDGYYKTTFTKYSYKNNQLIKKVVYLNEKYYHRNGHHYSGDEDRLTKSYKEFDGITDEKIFSKWLSNSGSSERYTEKDLLKKIEKDYTNDTLDTITIQDTEEASHPHELGFQHYSKYYGHNFLCPAYKEETE